MITNNKLLKTDLLCSLMALCFIEALSPRYYFLFLKCKIPGEKTLYMNPPIREWQQANHAKIAL